MGRIKKVAAERHTASLTSFVSTFVQDAASTPLHYLPAKLDSFPQPWPFPRGDLYHWIPLLDRFDHILEIFNQEYGLDQGPQQQPFECRLLRKGDAEEGMPYPTDGAQEQDLQSAGYSVEGDRELVESVVGFTKVLFEHCGNRSLYNSSAQVGDLLNTSSLSLLRAALRLGLRLSQRFQAAKFKNGPHAHANSQQQHYRFNIDNLAKIAQVFPKPPQTASTISATPGKGKEKAPHASTYNPCDLAAIGKDPISITSKADLGSVQLTYYEQSAAPRPTFSHQPSEAAPTTPTPARRASALGPSRDRPGVERNPTADVGATPAKSKESEAAASSAPKSFTITSAKVSGTPAWALVGEALSKVPKDSQYDVLNRIRIAKALTTPQATAQELLEIRLLAIANLYYGSNETKFQEKVGIADAEEPKRFHLAHQLCELLQPPTQGQVPLSLDCEIAVLHAIEALSRVRHKAAEVADALQISQNHGVIYFELRKVIATMHAEPYEDRNLEIKEFKWREATFDLTNALLQTHTQPKQGQTMVSAGIMSILIEALTLRTARAERFHEKILLFLDSFIHGIPIAFTTLSNVKGFEILAELISYDVTSAIQMYKEGKGMPENQKSKVVDYEIPYIKQTTLRQLFKFVTHMYEHNAGTHDRLLRNFIDTPQVLGALRNVIAQGGIFGANVWTAAVSIVSSFIHNEPTSFQVVGEAGLVKSILQNVSALDLDEEQDGDSVISEQDIGLKYNEKGELQWPTAAGILPVSEAMVEIPGAFGAICLNEAGMKLFLSSRAVYSFMNVFVSKAHVTAMEEDGSSASSIGQSFDELSRHHPQLKPEIVKAVLTMVKRVGAVCKYLAEREAVGSKLYERTANGITVAGGQQALGGRQASEGSSLAPDAVQHAKDQQDDDRGKAMPFISACFKFLEGLFHNHGMCQTFCEHGGAMALLDVVASASTPHDITSFPVWSKFAPVFKSMVDQKPHLVLPSLIQRAQDAIAGLRPFLDSQNPEGAFSSFLDLSKPQIASLSGPDGTTVVKSLGMTNLLSQILGRALTPSHFHRAHQNQTNAFAAVNFTDVYVEMVTTLSQLHAACIWENLVLQKSLPEKWKGQTEAKPLMLRRINANGSVEIAQESRWDAQTNGNGSSNASADANGPMPDDQEERLSIKNARTVRYLLNQTPHAIECFLHSLAQAMVTNKRYLTPAAKQEVTHLAETLARALVWELEYRRFISADEVTIAKYTTSVLTVCARILTKNSGADFGFTKEALVMVMNRFYLANGFSKLNDILDRFCTILARNDDEKDHTLDNCARDGMNIILSFYKEVVRHKCITEASQSSAISVREVRAADYFMPGQFVVEIRDMVLPAVSKLWHSSALEKIGANHAKTIIEIMRIILKGEGEERGIKRSEKATRRVPANKFEFRPHQRREDDTVAQRLKSEGFEGPLTREATYRCNYHKDSSREYCQFHIDHESAPRFPAPGEEAEETDQAAKAAESGAELSRQQSAEMTDAEGVDDAQRLSSSTNDNIPSDDTGDDEPFRVANIPQDVQDRDLLAMAGGNRRFQEMLDIANPAGTTVTNPSAGLPAKDTHQPYITAEDLDERRRELREDILERCLEILSAQKSITFELADLIQAAVAKSGDSANPRADIGSTLISSLLSLQGEEPSEESGAKIAAYAHLIALILQDQDFFYSTLDELKEYFGSLVEWITLSPDQKMEDAPWVEMILLIIERVLAEDEQPPEVTWIPPPADDPLKALPVVEPAEPVVEPELKTSLFNAVVDLLPKVGKNASLALSAARVLVILTRNRETAKRMSDKHCMSKLFVMIRQMAGSVNEKLQGSFMVILRHLIEDEQIVRQIMQTEVRALFETHRTSRPMDTSTYARNLYHLAIRDPNLFVEVTKDMVDVVRYEGNPHRGQTITLKKDKPMAVEEKAADEAEADVQPTVEEGPAVDDKKAAEAKPPTVETTDGVIQYLLRELSNYRDVEDKPPALPKEPTAQPQEGETSDVDMTDATISTTTNGTPARQTELNSKPDKPAFKPEDHAIFIYRCFLMQCLSELLGSYNRTKVEFINFSRKADAQPATPSKPRSGTLNYLLNMLIPLGTLEHSDEMSYRKKSSTSHWATTVLVSLCSRTPECQTPREMRVNTAKEDNAELTFVQKFVLEHTLRSFKDATGSSEPLDQRYSRLLGLAELFNRLLGSKSDRNNQMGHETTSGASRHIGKLMYEKNFVSAITSAVAEIDLNFPNAKRAVKYLLNPLKQLTDLGLFLSQDSDFSSSAIGTSEEDDISSATSVSEEDEHEEREQTPDLYRNSTLGMFETGRNGRDDSDSDSEDDEDDEDMYDDGYEEEMDYEEEQMTEHGDVVSDEDDDEDVQGIGDDMGEIEGVHGDPVDMDIEVVMDGEGNEIESDDSGGDDSEDSEDDEDDDDNGFGHDIDAMDEITGDDGNASMADDHEDEGEWEEDGGEFDFAADEGGSPHGGPLDEIARVIGADDTSDAGEEQVIDLGDGDEEYFEDEMPPEEDDGEYLPPDFGDAAAEARREDEEIDYGHDVIYEPEAEGVFRELRLFRRLLLAMGNIDLHAEDDEDEPGTQWDFDAPPPPAAILRGGHHHHHHRHGGLQEMFALGLGGPPSRAHRSTSNGRGDDDGTNPLLQREGAAHNRDRDGRMDGLPGLVRRGMHRPGDALIQDLVATMGPGGNGTINISVDSPFGGGRGGPFMNGMFAIRGGNGTQLLDIDPARLRAQLPRFAEVHMHGNHGARTTQAGQEAQAVEFRCMPSVTRWQEEAKMLFGGKHHEKATRIINAILRALVPPAMEAKRQADIETAKRKKEDEERKQKEEEERKAEAEQRRKEQEEREAKETEEKRAQAEAERQEAEARGETSMEGVEEPRTEEEQPATSTRQPEAGRSATGEAATAAVPRVETTIRGRTIDITELGIDLTYLEALPEELREEVIMAQFAEQRSQQAEAGGEPSEISREFLDALPPEIQRELIRSENADRRRREREETQRQAREQGGAQVAQPEEMNNADFMATLDPALRQQILMDADEGVIAALPEELQAEARVLGGDGRHRFGARPGARPPGSEAIRTIGGALAGRGDQDTREGSRQRRPVIQMLDKAGIATLLRLMFVSLPQRAKGNLHNIFNDVCKNAQNRAEVISIVLSILADGTADVQAVERSFASLSLRARQQPAAKTPTSTPLKRTATGTVITPGAELSPLNIVQQCLNTLNALTIDNMRVPSFFLTEHETLSNQKAKNVKKGKANEVRAAKFPLNALLALLDRKLVTENTGVMEALAALLSRVTRPLTMLLRRQKAAEEAEKKKLEKAEEDQPETEGESSRPQTAGGDVQMGEATAEAPASAESAQAGSSTAADVPEPSTTTENTADGNIPQTSKTSEKKHRDLVPPEVPHENLRSVVNIITARECPAKTFSDTLDLIKNLSNLPGAKEIFGRELVSQAQELSKAVVVELEELAKQINAAQTGTDMQGLALTKFSSAASKQTKLLRVLVALDHLFDPQRTPSSGEDMSNLKQDVLAALHDSATFDQLWTNLSHCLTAIRNKGNMVNVAAILLPMIEALLVVCRNSTSLKDQPVEPGSPIAETPTTEAKLESLFFRFTEEHRKILNELIRNNPKLMHGNLAVLANNSKVLEFDNKRNYFNRKVHDRREQRVAHPSLQLNVRREQVFLDSFKSLYYKSGDEIKYGKLNIRFHGEEGIDAGGVSREWFAAMARQIFNPDYALFNPVASDRTTFHPNEFSDVNPEHLLFFRFIGRIIGKALYEGRLLDCHFSRAVYRKMLGKTVSLKDLESLELDHYKSLVWVLENDITDIITETFSIETDRFGEKKIVDLKPNGRNIEVTEENKQEWVRLIVEHKLVKSVQAQLDDFLAGFHDIIPAQLVSIFNEQELELLISGLPDIDVDDWKNNSEYHNYQATSPQIQWFWRAVRSFDKEEKAKLLQFVTGTSKVPLNGFKELEGMNGFAKFNVHRDYSSKEKLPSSHTCFNQLDLPEYESYEHLRQQLYTAITAGSEYFGFA